MAIAEKLTELQATKTAIKTAIEGKGQSLDGVPFTGYAEKISAIQGGGGGSDSSVYEEFVHTFLEHSMTTEVELKIPNGIKKIGENAISNWYKNTYGLKSLDLNEVENIGQQAFQNNRVLTNIAAPNLKELTYDCFYNCVALTAVYFPNVTTATSGNSFRSCTALKVAEFDIITQLSPYTFANCSSLDTLIIGSSSVCTLKGTFVSNVTNFANGTASIYVPDSLVDDYKSASNWANYASMIKPLSEYIE